MKFYDLLCFYDSRLVDNAIVHFISHDVVYNIKYAVMSHTFFRDRTTLPRSSASENIPTHYGVRFKSLLFNNQKHAYAHIPNITLTTDWLERAACVFELIRRQLLLPIHYLYPSVYFTPRTAAHNIGVQCDGGF